jgi:hypothetical protein
VLCPSCKIWRQEISAWDVGCGCTLCNDSLIVPGALAIEYALLGLGEKVDQDFPLHDLAAFEIRWSKEVIELRQRHGLKVDDPAGRW